jgi:ketosteroid isomerase-like protein
MKKLLGAAALSLVLVWLIFGQVKPTQIPTKSTGVEQELIKLENEWGDALIKSDVAFLGRILADDYVSTDFEGTVWTKAQLLAGLKSGEAAMTSTVLDDIKVRVYGDTAIVWGRTTEKFQLKGKDISGQFQWTDTWVRLAGRWQCVAGHGSKIVKK